MEKNEIEVFIVVSNYIEMITTEEGSATTKKGTEINAVYSTKERAEKMGKWLIDAGECNGRRYTDYKIENFLILD